MDIIQALKEELQIGRNQVEAAVKLIDEGNTIPFIARYRKEATGSLNDEVLRQLDERLRYLRNLEDKKEQVIGAIRAQEKLTPALEKQIRDAATLVAVEDLYLPYRPKRRTRAGIAREKGLSLIHIFPDRAASPRSSMRCAIFWHVSWKRARNQQNFPRWQPSWAKRSRRQAIS